MEVEGGSLAGGSGGGAEGCGGGGCAEGDAPIARRRRLSCARLCLEKRALTKVQVEHKPQVAVSPKESWGTELEVSKLDAPAA